MPLIEQGPGPKNRDTLLALACVLGVFLIVSWAIILSGNHSGRGAYDDLNYHWPTIKNFAKQLPHPDLGDYGSATTPGYHLALAELVRLGADRRIVQLAASVWTLALLGVLTWVASARFGKAGAAIALPMLASMYVLYPGIWLLPDNAGWLGVLLILLLALSPRRGALNWLASGLILMALIWVRQIHVWAAGVIWTGAWIGSVAQTPTPGELFSSIIERCGRALVALALTLPALAALVWFIGLWGGLVPPMFQDQHQGPNPATPGFILTQLSILSVFFAPLLLSGLRAAWERRRGWVILAAIVGLGLGMIPVSSYSVEAGRYSGWWGVVHKLPVFMDRSPIFVLGSVAGAIALCVWIGMVGRRDAWIWAAAFAAFVLSQSANHASWQRYHEPFLLMMILIILARGIDTARFRRSIVLGSLALALVLGSLTLVSLLGAEPIDPGPGTGIGVEIRSRDERGIDPESPIIHAFHAYLSGIDAPDRTSAQFAINGPPSPADDPTIPLAPTGRTRADPESISDGSGAGERQHYE